MKTTTEYIELIRSCSQKLLQDFGVRSLKIFGSVARNQQHKDSDIDVCIETETPNPFLILDLKEFLERLLGCPVDIIRLHRNMNTFLKEQIDKDGIYVL